MIMMQTIIITCYSIFSWPRLGLNGAALAMATFIHRFVRPISRPNASPYKPYKYMNAIQLGRRER